MAVDCELITGHAGSPHVSSADAAEINKGVVGSEIMFVNGLPELEMSDPNTLLIRGFTVITEGRYSTTETGTIAIDNAPTSGVRKDTIMLRYTLTGEIEKTELIYVKGEVATDEVTAKQATTEYVGLKIDDGEELVDFPLFAVTFIESKPIPGFLTTSQPDSVVFRGNIEGWQVERWSSGFVKLSLPWQAMIKKSDVIATLVKSYPIKFKERPVANITYEAPNEEVTLHKTVHFWHTDEFDDKTAFGAILFSPTGGVFVDEGICAEVAGFIKVD